MSRSNTNPDIPVLTALTDEQVAAYLRRNPDFLVDKPALLADLNLPHHTDGRAVSLIERQVSVLRERNMDMRHRLTKLLENARTNDGLFDKSKRLLLALLDTHQWDDLQDALFFHLQQDFAIEQAALVLMDNNYWPQAANQQVRILSLEIAQQQLGDLMTRPRALCGKLDEAALHCLFDQQANTIGSTAVAPLLLNNDLLGFIAIGNHDPNYYRSSMNTLFLSFIADALSRLLVQLKKS